MVKPTHTGWVIARPTHMRWFGRSRGLRANAWWFAIPHIIVILYYQHFEVNNG